jgi:DNA-binding transcriptional LysR family regulator
MSVTFRQLEVFIEAAKDCNFRKTADRLGISQPSVSNQIRALERWAGCDVFERSRGATPRLSKRGTAVLAEAQQVLAGKGRLVTNVSPRPAKEKFRLSVAAGPYILDRYIRTALPRFLEKHPNIVLDFLPPDGALNLRRAVRRSEADIAVYTVGRSARTLEGAELICEVPCSLYGSPRLARLAAKGRAAIESLPFVLPLEGSDMERWMLRALKKAGISPRNIVARCQFADVIADMVVSHQGVSALFDEHMFPHVQAGRASRLGPSLESGSRVLLLGPRARGRAAAPFVGFVRQVLKPKRSTDSLENRPAVG